MATFTGSAAGDSIRPGNISGTVGISGPAPFDLSVNDFIFGLGGDDSLDGGAGNDVVEGGDGADTVLGGIGDDTLRGGSTFAALDLADSLNGGDGADRIEQIGAGDRALGAGGDDVLNIDESGALVLDGGAGVDALEADGFDISAATITGIENLANSATLSGAQLALFARVGTGSATFATTYTYTFVNTIAIADFTGRIADANDRFTLQGVDGVANADRITFDLAAFSDVSIQGFEGNDSLRGGAGDDTISGDEGRDSLFGGNGSDILNAGAAFLIGDDIDTLDGGGGSDILQQLGLGDIARGAGGNDVLDIDESGPATLDGGAGVDTLVADGLDISASTVLGLEVLWNNATMTGAQATAFATVGASTTGFATTYTYVITDAAVADFTGAIAEDIDRFTIRGVDGVAIGNRILFDAASTARVSLQGYEGDDSLVGGAANDVIEGDEGADTLIGGAGADELSAGFTFQIDDGADSLVGGAGDDILLQLGTGDTALGGDGADVFNVDEGTGGGLYDGGLGVDILVADGLDISGRTITGIEWLWNNAILTGSQLGGFSLVGVGSFGSASTFSYTFTNGSTASFVGKVAEGNDTYNLQGVDGAAVGNIILFDPTATNLVNLRGYEGSDRLQGGAGNDTLTGDEGSDTLIGGAGGDEINAGFVFSVDDGADSVSGGAGADVISEIGFGDIVDAGTGNDVVNLDEAGAVSLIGGSGIDLLVTDGIDISGAVVTTFERLWNNAVLTSAQSVQFTQFGASTPGSTTTYTYGFSTATNAIDLTGRLADDFDAYVFNGSSTLANADTILVGVDDSNNVTINGFAGGDSLRGGEGDDVLNGGDGNDTLDGGRGLNTLDGGLGVDTVSFASSATGVTVNLSLVGAQQVSASAFNSLIAIESAIGSGFSDTITGTGGSNTLVGGGGSDLLLAGGGADVLFGDAGADTLNGGAGNDQLTGGDGADRFLFNPGGGTDTVFDYVDGTDRIAVSGFGTAFDTSAEVRAAASQAVGGVQIVLGSTTVLISGLSLASFTAADIDVVVV